MDLRAIISTICDEADDFLNGATKRDEAKAGIAEWLTINHPTLSPLDRKAIVAQALAVLSEEGFFERTAGGDE